MMAPVFAHGQLRLYLLSLLESGPKHGYELITDLSDRFGGTYRPSPGTVYPRLARLEEEGLVVRVDEERKSTYALTDAGRAELEARRGDLALARGGHRRVGARARRAGARRRPGLDARAARRPRGRRAAGARRRRPAHAGRRATTRAPRRTCAGRTPRSMIQRFRDEIRAELRKADAQGKVEQLTVDTLRTVLDTALTAVRGTLR